MMTGSGPFGAVGMGGMFSVIKVRKEQKAGDYSDQGWFKHPPGSVAYEWTGALAPPSREFSQDGVSKPPKAQPATPIDLRARRPSGHGGHSGH